MALPKHMNRGVLDNLRLGALGAVMFKLREPHSLSEIVRPLIVKQCVFYAQAANLACACAGKRYGVGFIGCGLVGRAVLDALLQVGCDPSLFTVSTRRPEMLERFRRLGVNCGSDNSKVARRSRVMFLCCLPSQLARVAQSLRGHLRKTTLLVSIVAGVRVVKLRQLFGTHECQLIRTVVNLEVLRKAAKQLRGSSTSFKRHHEIAALAAEQLLQAPASVAALLLSISFLLRRLGASDERVATSLGCTFGLDDMDLAVGRTALSQLEGSKEEVVHAFAATPLAARWLREAFVRQNARIVARLFPGEERTKKKATVVLQG